MTQDDTPRRQQPDRRTEQRRASARRPASAIPDLKARLVTGGTVKLVNISKRGVLLETDARLTPHSAIAMRFFTSKDSLVLKGCVVRSSVAVLNGQALTYRTAVSFERDISICDESLWHEDVAAEPEPGAETDNDVSIALVQDSTADDALFQTNEPVIAAQLDDDEWVDLNHLLND